MTGVVIFILILAVISYFVPICGGFFDSKVFGDDDDDDDDNDLDDLDDLGDKDD